MVNHISSALPLASLEVENFRAFEHTRIDKLARVNLIVGKNNVGKSTLLEALQVYADKGSLETLASILEFREETLRKRSPSRPLSDLEDGESAIRSLFHKRDEGSGKPFVIGLGGAANGRLSVALKIYFQQIDEQGNRKLIPADSKLFGDDEEAVLALAIQYGKQSESTHRLNRLFDRRSILSSVTDKTKSIFVRSNGLSSEEIGAFWDNTTLTEGEEDVLQALQLIDQRVERVNLIGAPALQRERDRVAQVSLKQGEGRIPLRSLGDGMNRLFGISLALVNSTNGLLMIDEIDTGLHYSVLPKLWRLVFEVARRLSIQVFATTHSWDCIQAFQAYLSESRSSDGQVISLRRKPNTEGTVSAVLWDERRLSIATQDDIEVR